ncbi:hypothetical protein ABWH97_07700 [Nitratireductor sp. ac15]
MSNSKEYEIAKNGGTVSTTGKTSQEKERIDADVDRGKRDSGRS